jgi:hypothetical protein
MNNQFATQFLRETVDPDWLKNYMIDLGADQELIEYTLILIEKGLIKPERAIEIMKQTLGLTEDGGAAAAAPAGGSTTGGGVTNGASFTPGTGEQYAMGTKKVRKKLGEDEGSEEKAVDVTGKAYSIGDIIEFRGHKFECQIGQRGIAVLQHVDDELNPLPEFYEGGTPQFTAILKNAKIISSKGGKVAEDAPRLAGEPSKTNKQGVKNLNAYKSAGFTKAPSAAEAGKKLKSIDVKELWEEEPLNENYFRFRNETKTRGKSEQFHEAVKIINKKLDEVNRLLEFTGTLKTELSEGEENFEVKTNTKKAMDKVRGKVVEAYQKLKQL